MGVDPYRCCWLLGCPDLQRVVEGSGHILGSAQECLAVTCRLIENGMHECHPCGEWIVKCSLQTLMTFEWWSCTVPLRNPLVISKTFVTTALVARHRLSAEKKKLKSVQDMQVAHMSHLHSLQGYCKMTNTYVVPYVVCCKSIHYNLSIKVCPWKKVCRKMFALQAHWAVYSLSISYGPPACPVQFCTFFADSLYLSVSGQLGLILRT